MKIKNNAKLSFGAGLNTRILLNEFFANPRKQEKYFLKNYGIITDFADNPSVAYANRLCLKIFDSLAQKLNIDLDVPPMITVYAKQRLLQGEGYSNFCIPDTRAVLSGDLPFVGGSLFFKNYKSLKQVDSITENLFKNGKTSSNHFLAPFIHDWLHFFHLDYLYKKHGYPGDCEYMQQLYPLKNTGCDVFEFAQKRLNNEENQIVAQQLGSYAAKAENQYFEVFSETFTKFICECLSKDCTKVTKNPLDLLRQTPEKFQRIIAKVTDFEA